MADQQIKGGIPEFTGNALGLEHHEALTSNETKVMRTRTLFNTCGYTRENHKGVCVGFSSGG
uniref:Uncharacterized protein n=1 Tax=Magallana gigas TaxID=29159 RepID=K1PSJ2_MAGGI